MYIYISILYNIYIYIVVHWSPRFKGWFCYQIQRMFLLSPKDSTLTLFRHGTISKIVHPTSRLLVFHISFSPKKGNRDLFRSFFRWVLRLFVPLVLLFQFLGFCLWKCQASIFGQVLKLEDFPKSTNWWWVKHILNIAGNTKPHNWCVPCAFSIHASAKYLHQ